MNINYEDEYKGLLMELCRHIVPEGRMAALRAYYRIGEDPAIKLFESPYITRALAYAGADISQKGGFTELSIGASPYGLCYHLQDVEQFPDTDSLTLLDIKSKGKERG